jgi:hypothetical protein
LISFLILNISICRSSCSIFSFSSRSDIL